jgi:NAD(P)-dependent dehydrogenase (short-subunit alcohol dehydrogenase family)
VIEGVTLDGRVAIVTGGGRGLGEGYALELARRGAQVVVHDNGSDPAGNGFDPGPANTVAKAIVAAGGQAVPCTTDASTESGGAEAVELALSKFGKLDVIIANAGNINSAPFSEYSTQSFTSALTSHLLAAFHVVRPGFAVMKAARYGRLVFVASAAGVFGQPGLLGYATAKTGMLGMMNVAAIEGAEFGITANAIMPMAATRMAAALFGEAIEAPEAREFLDSLRIDQVAPVVAYLASERCTETRTVLSAFRGRVAQLHIGVTNGWLSPTGQFTAEDVESHLAEISDTSGLLQPENIFDEIAHTVAMTDGALPPAPS